MENILSRSPLILAALLLVGCTEIFGPGSGDATVRPVARPDVQAIAPPADATTAAQFDTTTDAEREAAKTTSTANAEVMLGRTIASLGNPANPGFWLETPLVSGPKKGRIVDPASGKSVSVDLIPIDGPATAGSRISLPAMRLLGVSLTGLPELIVYAG